MTVSYEKARQKAKYYSEAESGVGIGGLVAGLGLLLSSFFINTNPIPKPQEYEDFSRAVKTFYELMSMNNFSLNGPIFSTPEVDDFHTYTFSSDIEGNKLLSKALFSTTKKMDSLRNIPAMKHYSGKLQQLEERKNIKELVYETGLGVLLLTLVSFPWISKRKDYWMKKLGK